MKAFITCFMCAKFGCSQNTLTACIPDNTLDYEMDNSEMRNDEISAMSAIYGDDWIVENAHSCSFTVTIFPDNHQQKNGLKFEIKLPETYPMEQKPLYSISAPWMSRHEKANLFEQLEQICEANKGECVLFLLTDRIREFLNNSSMDFAVEEESPREENEEVIVFHKKLDIYHGQPLVDRKSTFQAHLAEVKAVEDVQNVLGQLKEYKKVSTATHNMWAYRIANQCGGVSHDCDDDGENHAGSRLLKLLEIVDAKNVLVVVSRWYGGILLGADRFKHINNVARDLLVERNYISTSGK